MKFAAIDIGSNAVRLLFCNVYDDGGKVEFTKAELIRVPIRLGEDSFLHGSITKQKADKLVTAMKAFKNLIEVYDAIDYRACATSAMRDAENRYDIVDRVRQEAGIKIEIIDGKTEADIIYSNHIEEHLDKSNNYLYIDIGGGSTEITLFSKNKAIVSQSFNIGTIRMLHNQIDKDYWTYFKKWIEEITKGYKPLIAIGSGGNINKLFKMSGRKINKPRRRKVMIGQQPRPSQKPAVQVAAVLIPHYTVAKNRIFGEDSEFFHFSGYRMRDSDCIWKTLTAKELAKKLDREDEEYVDG